MMTALAAGGAVALLGAAAVALWPRTYGAEAAFVLDGAAKLENPVALAGRVEAMLLERDQLASAAMELPPELRSPDPIGKLRAGIRVQSRGGAGFAVEFRGSDPHSVQRIANRLADKAVAVIPKLTATPPDDSRLELVAQRSRAVSDFLRAHPEMTEQAAERSATASEDRALDLLRSEKRQIEQRLETGAADNPYLDPGDSPALLQLRLVEVKNLISRREAALKRPAASAAKVSPELATRWRQLLTELAQAQAQAAAAQGKPGLTAHITARAELPDAPLTPNRLVLSLVAVLLSLAAAMLAYVLPRKATLPGMEAKRARRQPGPGSPGGRMQTAPTAPERPASDPPPGPEAHSPAAATAALPRSDPPPPERPPSQPPSGGSKPPQRSSSSDAPGRVAPQRVVVVSSSSASAHDASQAPKRSTTDPGGLQAPRDGVPAAAPREVSARSSPPTAPVLTSRPPPGAGSYSVSSSHPPPLDGASPHRATVERLSPLQSARPPRPQSSRGASPPPGDPQIMSRPPALDPEAERWAARFEVPPPAGEPAPEQPRRKSGGRWTTQVMGSMVPLEVTAAREARPHSSHPGETALVTGGIGIDEMPAQPDALFYEDVPPGWQSQVDAQQPQVLTLRDAVLAQGLSRRLRIAVTGPASDERTELAAGLAFALAEAGARVLLVEADFERPQLHHLLALAAPHGAGFSQQIVAHRQDRTRPWVVLRCSQNLLVLAEGRLRAPGMLASEEFASAIRELGEHHHVVVIHAPALDRPSDLSTVDDLAQVAVIANPPQAATIQFGSNPLRSVL